LGFGGVIGPDEDEDVNAIRELQEELSIPEPEPVYSFKFKYDDGNTRGWIYTYYQIYHGIVKA
jgi:8-oxo-dGTP pyrophosphatase MutT (NUDIX family)